MAVLSGDNNHGFLYTVVQLYNFRITSHFHQQGEGYKKLNVSNYLLPLPENTIRKWKMEMEVKSK